MTNNTIELLIEALEKDELDKFLIGESKYYLINKWVDHPTDVSHVFYLFNRYIENDNDKQLLNQKIHEALLKLLETPIGTWWCLYIVSFYLFEYNKILFGIRVDNLVPSINHSVKKFSKELENEKAWTGKLFPNGLIHELRRDINRVRTVIKGIAPIPNS